MATVDFEGIPLYKTLKAFFSFCSFEMLLLTIVRQPICSRFDTVMLLIIVVAITMSL